MQTMMLVFYDFFLILYKFSISLTSLWNPKAKKWKDGRQDILQRIKDARSQFKGPLVWFHAASLGEFEQGRSLIEAIKLHYPHYSILLTFFSPSGYEVRKNYKNADMIFYLPMDGKKTSNEFLEIINPSFAIFIKYESWHYYLSALKTRNIPTFLISAHFTPNLVYFGIVGSFFRKMLNSYSHIFVQNNDSIELLKKYNVSVNTSISGDTRYDRVLEITSSDFKNERIEKFCQSAQVIVAGSTWDEDELLLKHLQEELPQLKLVIAPHDIGKASIERVKSNFHNPILLSENKDYDSNVLIIDSIGMLSSLYRLGTLCYVGGGFNPSGIHNILEPAAYGKVVIFGKEYWYSLEAKQLIGLGAAFSVSTKQELVSTVELLLKDSDALDAKNKITLDFVRSNQGATKKIMSYLESNMILKKG
jgi:3-deoxy-D-manno-octulosonic-acid transferase